jgi:EAL domain-containing protein (putative c-di-GMP-specific phosphodiesterase class I)
MDLLVVAEGVEHADQAARARELGCDFGQGWLYCAAVGQDEIGASAIALQRALDRGGVA